MLTIDIYICERLDLLKYIMKEILHYCLQTAWVLTSNRYHNKSKLVLLTWPHFFVPVLNVTYLRMCYGIV